MLPIYLDIVETAFDEAGRPLRRTDQKGDTITTVYDMASRVLSGDYRLKANSPSGTIADQDTFTYDSSSRMLIGVSGRYGNTVTNTFDNAGRLSTESLTIGGQAYIVTSEYDLRSQRKKVTYPNSSTWERTYTARRQLYETKYNGSTVDTRAYDDGGRLDTSTYANGVIADYNWRADNLLADIGFSHPGGVAANRRIGTYTYAWDANKNKTKETITGQISGFSFDTTLGTDPDGYDDEDRLTYFKRQSTSNPQTWNLSLVGDWNSWSNFGTTQSRTHGQAHEILTAGNTPNNAVTHDVKGNMTDIPSNILSPARKLFWDFDNQLTGVDTTGDSKPEVTYEYDVLHRRVARIEGSNSKVYIHSGNQIIADYNRGSAANTTPAFRYVWGDYIDEPILRQTGSTTILYYHRNQQYSIIALTNTSGEVVEHYGYTAYGQLTVMNYLGNVRSWSDWSNRFLYTGREWDDTIKLFHFRARWYEPVAGRFVSRDPLGYVDGMGLYGGFFVPDDLDPYGLDDYKLGNDDPDYTSDKGAGQHGIHHWWDNGNPIYLWWKWKRKANNAAYWGYPDAARHMDHYLGNSGSDLWIRLGKMVEDSRSARRLFEYELGKAQEFAETLPAGEYEITSGKLSRGAVPKHENHNWYYAVHGYRSWGKGKVQIKCTIGDDGATYNEIKMLFEYRIRDRYNWDAEKGVLLNGVWVPDSELARLHQFGMAKEFDMFGRMTKFVIWKTKVKPAPKPQNVNNGDRQ